MSKSVFYFCVAGGGSHLLQPEGLCPDRLPCMERAMLNQKRAKMATAVGVNFHAHRHKKRRVTAWKTMGNGIKNDGQRRYITTGNEIYNDGQQNLELRATEIRATGNENQSNGRLDLELRATWFFGATGNVDFWETDVVGFWATDIVNFGETDIEIFTQTLFVSRKTRAYLIYSLSMRIYIYALE